MPASAASRPASVLLALLFLCACSSSDRTRASQPVRLGDTLVLERGETARFIDSDVAVRFDSVSNDTRCPEDIECAERGSADVHFSLIQGDSTAPFVLQAEGLLPSDAAENTARAITSGTEMETIEVQGFSMGLFLLQPYPGFAAERGMPPTAVLLFERAEEEPK